MPMRATLRLAAAMALIVGALPAFHLLNKAGAMTTVGLVERPALVDIHPGSFAYRSSGEFSEDGRPARAPSIQYRLEGRLEMMAHQVTVGEYERCVAARACEKLAVEAEQRADFPVVQVSWQDATSYASWLSAKTGDNYRLPTDEEWAYAAGSRFKDDALTADNPNDPSRRWLAEYDRENGTASVSDTALRPVGGFGANERGVLDFSGNVSEWTNTCFVRRSLDKAGRPQAASVENCGVRVVEGEHRGYVPNFIRDARAGGCAIGKPPRHLGFRLMRERGARFRPIDGA